MDREAHLRLGGGPNSVLTLPNADLKGRVAHGVKGQEPLDSGSQTDILKESYPASLGHGRSRSNRQLKLSPVTVARTTSIRGRADICS